MSDDHGNQGQDRVVLDDWDKPNIPGTVLGPLAWQFRRGTFFLGGGEGDLQFHSLTVAARRGCWAGVFGEFHGDGVAWCRRGAWHFCNVTLHFMRG